LLRALGPFQMKFMQSWQGNSRRCPGLRPQQAIARILAVAHLP